MFIFHTQKKVKMIGKQRIGKYIAYWCYVFMKQFKKVPVIIGCGEYFLVAHCPVKNMEVTI